MELVEPLQSYYLRKQRIKIHVKLPHHASRVACTILDGHGNDITNANGLLYSKANILHAQNASSSRKCLLYVNFTHAIRHVGLKLIAYSSSGEALGELFHRLRVYSQHPKGLQKSLGAETVVPQQGTLGKRNRRHEKDERLADMEWIDMCFNEEGGASLLPQSVPKLCDEAGPTFVHCGEIVGVPALPVPLVSSIHQLVLKQAVKTVVDSDQAAVGFVGMTGIGKTTVLSRLARHPAVMQAFSGGVFWIRAGLDTSDSYSRIVALGKKMHLQLMNSAMCPRRAMECLLSEIDDKCLIVIDDVWHSGQIRDLYLEIQRTDSKLVVGTTQRCVLAELGGENIHMDIPSIVDSVRFVEQIVTSTNPSLKQNAAVQVIDNASMVELVEYCGCVPFAMNIAARCKTDLLKFSDVLQLFQNNKLFGVGARFETFSKGMEHGIRLLSKEAKMALLCLSVVGSNHLNESGSKSGSFVSFRNHFFALSMYNLPRLWNVGVADARIIFQSLLDSGFVGMEEINSRDGKTETFLLLHVMVAKYLEECAITRKMTDIRGFTKLLEHDADKIHIFSLYTQSSRELEQLYALLNEAFLSKSPSDFLHRHRKDFSTLSQTLRQKSVENSIHGLENAVTYMNAAIEQEKQNLIQADRKVEAKQWDFDTRILECMRKSRADFIIAFLTYSCQHSEMLKDPEERTYDVGGCLQAMRSFLEFGWKLAEFKGLDVDTCQKIMNKLGIGIGSGPDGRTIYVIGLNDTTLTLKPEGVTARLFFSYCWMEMHVFLFQKNVQDRCMDSVFSIHACHQMASVCREMLISAKSSVLMDRACAFLYNRCGSISLYAKASTEAIYYESMAITMNCVFSGASFRLVRSKHEWEKMKGIMQPSLPCSQDQRWGLLVNYKPPTSEEQNVD